MEHYTDLAFRYIKMKKGRSRITVFGVSISVMLLYIVLNLGWSYVLNDRARVREQKDYEIVLLAGDQAQVEEILKERHVKSAAVGEYYEHDYYEPVTWHNAVYINTTNPYRMEKILAELTEKYGVEGKLNQDLAPDYLQGPGYEGMYIGILVYLLVSYIFAIFGVGLIRNSIQLTLFEQVKDLGNLRCIGATLKQMERIILIQGALLEAAGIAGGVLLGWPGSLLAGYLLGWRKAGFHVLPIVFIVAAFLFDLCFATEENVRLVKGMSPVSAIRGEYRIRVRQPGRWRIFGKGGMAGGKEPEEGQDTICAAGEKECIKRHGFRRIGGRKSEEGPDKGQAAGEKECIKRHAFHRIGGRKSEEGSDKGQAAGEKERTGRHASRRSGTAGGRKRRMGVLGGLLSGVFGIEGEYAYKNLMRSPGRFVQIVTTMTLGVAAVMILSCGALTLFQYDRRIKDYFGYYPVYVSWPVGAVTNWEDAVSRVPFTKLNEEIQDLAAVTDAKRILTDEVFVADYEQDMHSHFTEAYIRDRQIDGFREGMRERLRQAEADGTSPYAVSAYRNVLMSEEAVCVTGYDERDLKRCEKELLAGTLDVSGDGIIVVQNAYIVPVGFDEETQTYTDELEALQFEQITEYSLGDQVRLVDMEEYRKRLTEAAADGWEEYRKNDEELNRMYMTHEGASFQWEKEDREREAELSEAVREYNTRYRLQQAEILEQLRQEGRFRTYTVEGILKRDPNGSAIVGEQPQFIVPAARFHETAGREADFFNGMMYHFEPFSLRQYEKVDWNGIEGELENGMLNQRYYQYSMSEYPYWEYTKRDMRNRMLGAALVTLFLVSMVSLNYINNVASGIYLRRREFAQLRVIGVSRRRLFKMVMLEGVAAAVLSGVLGILLGAGISYGLITWIVRAFMKLEFVFPWIPGICAVAGSVLVLCGAVYVPLKKMGNDLAPDLTLSGE